MKILLTGSNGFIGKHISSTHKVDCINRSEHDLKNEYNSNIMYDVIIHCASTLTDDIDKCINDNIISTKNILKFASKHCKKFVFISSIKVYGYGDDHTEHDTPSPISTYGWSKLFCEHLCHKYSDTIDILIIRLGCTWCNCVKHNSFQYIIQNKFKDESCPHFVVDDKNHQWIHVNDAICSIMLLIVNEKSPFQIFNICGENMSHVDFIKYFGNEFTYTLKPSYSLTANNSKFKEFELKYINEGSYVCEKRCRLQN